MRGIEIKTIAKKSLGNIFKKGDEVIVQSILREKDKQIVNAIVGLFDKDDKFMSILISPFSKKPVIDKEVGEKVPYSDVSEYAKEGSYITKMFEPVIAKKGDYNGSVIIVNGREYCGEILGYRPLKEYFEKVVN